MFNPGAVIEPYLAQLYERTRCTVQLAVLVDGAAVAACCVTGPRDDVIGVGHEPVVLHVAAQASRAYKRAEIAAERRAEVGVSGGE